VGSNKSKTNGSGQSQPVEAAPAKKKIPMVPATIAFVVVIIAIVFIASTNAGTVRIVDGKISRTMATVDECAEFTAPLVVPEGQTIEQVAETIFDSLSQTTGVGLVTIYVDDPRVDINYCQSYSNEPALSEILATAGYLGE